jgi:ABC-type antimicrobial peptide transport system permease subunit
MITNMYSTIAILIVLIGIISIILYYSLQYVNNSIKSDKLSMLSMYQYTEIVVGTLMFFIMYVLYMSIVYRKVDKIDLTYSTFAVGLLLTIGNIVSTWVEYNNE